MTPVSATGLCSPARSIGARARWRDLGSRVILLGLASGFFFALSGVGYRAATLAVDSSDPFLRALVSLSFVNLMQCGVLLAWLRAREPGEIAAVWQARRVAVWMGMASMAGLAIWSA